MADLSPSHAIMMLSAERFIKCQPQYFSFTIMRVSMQFPLPFTALSPRDAAIAINASIS